MLVLKGVRSSRRPLHLGVGLAALLIVAAGLGLMAAGDTAEAHAHLRVASPAQGAVITQLPEQVELLFSEAVEVGFSTFKIYPLPPVEENVDIRDAARALVSQVLSARNDEGERADAGLVTTSRSETVVIRLKENLDPGTYVVMWRALSADTHVVEGFYTFTYRPEE